MSNPLLTREAYQARIHRRNRDERRAILLIWALLICGLTLATLSPLSSPQMQALIATGIPHQVGHFLSYVFVTIPPVLACRRRRQGLLLGASMFLLGILLELSQHFVPTRHPQLTDALINGAGVATGLLLATPIRSRLAIY